MSSASSGRSSIVSSGEMSFGTQCTYSGWESFSLTDPELLTTSNSFNSSPRDLRLRTRCSLSSTDSETESKRFAQCKRTLSVSCPSSSRQVFYSTGTSSSIMSLGEMILRAQCSSSACESFSLTDSSLEEMSLEARCGSSACESFSLTDSSLEEMSLEAQCSSSARESFSLTDSSLEEMSLEAQCSSSACESFSLTDSSLEEMSLEAQCSSSACKSFFLNALETSSQSHTMCKRTISVSCPSSSRRVFYSTGTSSSIMSLGEMILRAQCSSSACESFSLNALETSSQSTSRLLTISNSINSSPRDLRLRTQCSLSSTDSLAESKSLTQTFSMPSATRLSLLTLSSRPTVFITQLSSTASVFTSNIRSMSSGSLALPPNGERLKMQQMVEGAFNKFVELGQYLGGGTYGKVYKARDRSDFRKEFVVKIMARNTSGKNEIDIMQKINGHPNVVEILGHGSNSQYYHVFMSLDGTWSFYEFCKKFQAHLSEEAVRYFFNQMATAVDHLHSLDVAHLDIKPLNMVINDALQVKLIDFGLSKDLRHEGRGPFPGHYGTCIFMAAEMLQGRYGKCYPKPADIWSLGVTLFTCVFGYYPFDISADDYIKKRTSRYFTTPMNYMPELKDLLDGMLNYSLAERYDIYHVRKHNWCQGSTNFDINNFLMQPKKKRKTIQLSPSPHNNNYVHINVSTKTSHTTAMPYSSCSLQANVSGTSNCAISSTQQLSRILNTKASNNQDMIDSHDNSVAPTLPLRQWVLEVPTRPMSAPGKLYSRTSHKKKPLKTSTTSNKRKSQLGLVEKRTELEKKSEKRHLSNEVLSKAFINSIVSATNDLPQPTTGSIMSTNNALSQSINDSIMSTSNTLPQPTKDSIVSTNDPLPQSSKDSIVSTNNALPHQANDSIVSKNNALPHETNDSIMSTNNALPQSSNDTIVSKNNALPHQTNDSIVSTNNALPQSSKDSIVSTNNAIPQSTKDSIVSTNDPLPQSSKDSIVSTNNALPHQANDSIVSKNNALPHQTNDSIMSTNNALPQSSNDTIVSKNNALPHQTNDSIVSTNNALPQSSKDSIVSTNNALPHQTNDSIVSTDNALSQQNTASHVSQSILKATRLFFQGALALYHGSWPQSY